MVYIGAIDLIFGLGLLNHGHFDTFSEKLWKNDKKLVELSAKCAPDSTNDGDKLHALPCRVVPAQFACDVIPKILQYLFCWQGHFWMTIWRTSFFGILFKCFRQKIAKLTTEGKAYLKKNKVIRWALDSTESFTMCRLSVFKICKFWKFHLSLFRGVDLEISRLMGC